MRHSPAWEQERLLPLKLPWTLPDPQGLNLGELPGGHGVSWLQGTVGGVKQQWGRGASPGHHFQSVRTEGACRNVWVKCYGALCSGVSSGAGSGCF